MIELILGILSSTSAILIAGHYLRQIRAVKLLTHDQSMLKSDIFSHPLTVLICVKGDAPLFSKYLDKILAQDYPCFEVIVVYNQLSSVLLGFLEQRRESNSHLMLYALDESSAPYREKKQALHFGIQRAQYDWIVTTDDDCYPESNQWLQAVNKEIAQSDCDILLGISPFISYSTLLNRWIRFDWTLGTWNMVYQTISNHPYMGIGRNMAFKKSLWTSDYLARYESLGHADDTCLVQYYRDKKIALMLNPKVYTMPKLSWKEWFIQKNRHLSSGNYMQRDHLKNLAYLPLLSILFWSSIWVWMSFFNISLCTFGNLVFYLLVKSFSTWRMETLLGTKKSIWYTTPLFDFMHNFYLILAPLFTIFISSRWKSIDRHEEE